MRANTADLTNQQLLDALTEQLGVITDNMATKDDLREVEKRLDGRIDGLEERLDGVDKRLDGIDLRLDGIDERLDGIDARFDAVDVRLDGVDARFDKADRQFERIDAQFEVVNSQLDRMATAVVKGFDRVDRELAAKADKKDVNQLYNLIDATAKRREIDDEERLVMGHQLERHDRWIHEVAGRVDHQLSD